MPDGSAVVATPGRAEKLVDVIAQTVPVTILSKVATELALVPDFELRRRGAPTDPAKASEFLAKLVVEAAGVGALPTLARALCRELWQDNDRVKLLYPFTAETVPQNDAQEAAIALRAHTLRLPELTRSLANWEKWICVIAAVMPNGDVKRGTGALVGPDLVLTAYHNVKTHLDQGRARRPLPGPLYAIFDHLDGEPITDPERLRTDALKVPFADDWLVAACEDVAGDGEIRDPDSEQLGKLREGLDFAIVRLNERVGRYARRLNAGGPRRAWLEVALPHGPLRHQDRIIIPQHPGGAAQRIDFGRFSGPISDLDQSNTRLRYDTETDKGTSGAPCFNQHFELVGVHNAYFDPPGGPDANQAIRLERILDFLENRQLRKLLIPPPPAAAGALWNVSLDPAKPRVILGRQKLLAWTEQAAATADTRAERLYAAACRGEGVVSTKAFGKSFTVEVLKAARRPTADRIVVLGTKDELLPPTVADVIGSIADQLGISRTELDGMPPRPTEDGSVQLNTDKLWRWASELVPRWFDEILRNGREFVADEREEAQEEIRLLDRLARPIPDSLRALADSLEEKKVIRTRWNIVWIALDRLAESRMSDDVSNLIAGLTGAKLEESTMPAELRRLRWLFLGYVPDFLAEGDVTRELLDPMEIAGDAFVAGLEALAARLDKPLQPGSTDTAKLVFGAFDNDNVNPSIKDPNQRLVLLQNLFPNLAKELKEL